MAMASGMSRFEWLQARKKGIGGSDVAAILGLDPWRSAYDVWLDKTGKEMEYKEETEAMRMGNVLEPVIATLFTEKTGIKARRRNAILQHPEHPFMLANIDRSISDPERGTGVLECKAPGFWAGKSWEDEQVPEWYLLQIHHYMAVTGYSYGYMAALIGGQRFVCQLVERDEEIIEHLIKLEGEFWRYVQEDIPPPIDPNHENANEALKQLFPESNEESIELDTDAEKHAQSFEFWKQKENEAKAEKDRCAALLKAKLADAEVGVTPGGLYKIRWKTVKKQSFDQTSLEKEHPDIYEKYVSSTSYRRFEVKGDS